MRIERVVLFGSRARGEASAESDHDIAIFLHDLTDRAPSSTDWRRSKAA
jgi:predicted nucleotidyltransferase